MFPSALQASAWTLFDTRKKYLEYDEDQIFFSSFWLDNVYKYPEIKPLKAQTHSQWACCWRQKTNDDNVNLYSCSSLVSSGCRSRLTLSLSFHGWCSSHRLTISSFSSFFTFLSSSLPLCFFLSFASPSLSHHSFLWLSWSSTSWPSLSFDWTNWLLNNHLHHSICYPPKRKIFHSCNCVCPFISYELYQGKVSSIRRKAWIQTHAHTTHSHGMAYYWIVMQSTFGRHLCILSWGFYILQL